jgi:hypothetical protein
MMKWKATPPRDHSNLELVPKLLTQDLLSDDRRIVKNALSQLADLCILHDATTAEKNRHDLYTFGGHLLIVQVLKKWWKNTKIQRQGCRAIQNAGSAGLESVAFCDACVQVGAVETVLAAMTNFEGVEDVQRCAIGAILNLVLRSESNTKRLVITLDGIGPIVSAMKRYPRCRDLQEWAAWSLDNASGWADFVPILVKNGCVRVLAAAFEDYEQDVRIQQFTRRTLTRLCEPLDKTGTGLLNSNQQSINKEIMEDADERGSTRSSEAWDSALTVSTVTTDAENAHEE